MTEPYKSEGRSLNMMHQSAAYAAEAIANSSWNTGEKIQTAFMVLMSIAKDHGYTEAFNSVQKHIVPLFTEDKRLRLIEDAPEEC